MNSIEINNWQRDPSIAAIVKATFPNYRRKKVYICPSEHVGFHALNWSGGTRNEYRGATIDGQQVQGTGNLSRFNCLAPWDPKQIEGQSIQLPSGHVIVSGGHFCGKESLLRIHVHPSDMPKLLPAPKTVA